MSKTDIVETLKQPMHSRLLERVMHDYADGHSEGPFDPVRLEAADEITALRSQLAAVTAERDSIRAETIEACAHVAASHPGTNFRNASGHIDWRRATTHEIAAAIRAVGKGEQG